MHYKRYAYRLRIKILETTKTLQVFCAVARQYLQ